MIKVLFSESKEYYDNLGVEEQEGFVFEFSGMKLYKKNSKWLTDNYDILVCFMYTLPHNYMLSHKFKKHGKQTILVMDGIYDLANSIRNPMVRKFDVNLYEQIIQDFFFVVGENNVPLFDKKTCVINYMPKNIISKDLIAYPNKPRILITTSNNCYFNQSEYSSLIKLMFTTVKFLIERNIEFHFRLFDDKLLGELIKYIGFDVFNNKEGAFEDALELYTHVITTPSSIAITSIYHQRAVALFQYRDTPPSIYSGWLFSSLDTITMGFESFWDKDEFRMSYQNNMFAIYRNNFSINKAIKSVSKSTAKESISTDYPIEYYKTEVHFLQTMLDSKFNLNFEYLLRKVYLKFKSNKLIKSLKVRYK